MTRSQIFVITGASRGIGLELTRQALRGGHLVLAGVRNPDASEELKGLAQEHADHLRVFALDVRSDESARSSAASLGVNHVDVLINNAGVFLEADGKVEEVASQVLIDTFNTNSAGPIRVTQALLPLLRNASHPRVLNITSLMGSIADNGSGGSVAYRMSKAAVNMFTKSLACEEKKIIALSAHPGWVQTEMGGPNAPLTKDQSAEGLLSLLIRASTSDSGKFFNYNGREFPF